jgi:hypothetical protein
LPTIDAGVHIRDGQLSQGDEILLDGVGLDTGSLHAGEPFDLRFEAHDAGGRPLSLQLHALPDAAAATVNLDPLHIVLRAGENGTLDADGKLVWHGGDALAGAFDGKLHTAASDYALKLSIQSMHAVSVSLDGADTHVALSLSPQQAWQWWQAIGDNDNAGLPLPPVDGSVQSSSLDLGVMHVEGLRIDSGTAVPASVAATASAPAVAASVP